MRAKLKVSDCAPQETDCLSVLLALAEKRLPSRTPTPDVKSSGARTGVAKDV
jgi:hypothetical protein